MATETTVVYGGEAIITFHSGRAHYYTVDVPSRRIAGLKQPSVTGIIGKLDKSGALVSWAVDCYQKKLTHLVSLMNPPIESEVMMSLIASAKNTWRDVRDDAASIGSTVHARLEAELYRRSNLAPSPKLLAEIAEWEGKLTEGMKTMADAAFAAGSRYFDEHSFEIVQAESPRWSAEHGYIGTGDLIARVDGQLKVLDYKTSKRLYPTVALQLAAYQKAYEEEYGEKLTGRIAVNVGRDGSLETIEHGNDTLESDFACFIALLTVWRWDYITDTYKNPKGNLPPGTVGRLERGSNVSGN